MPVGLRIAINNLKSRRGRTALIIMAIALATSMVVAVTAAIQSGNKSIRAIMEDTMGRTDLRIRHQSQGRFDEAMLEVVEAWPEVATAAPRLSANIPLTNLNAVERAIGEDATLDEDELLRDTMRVVAAHGVDYAAEWSVHPPPLQEGVAPANADELVVDPRVARRLEIVVGDEIRVGSFGLEAQLTVTGILERQTLAILQKPEVRVPLEVLQRLTNRRGELTAIDITLFDDADGRVVQEVRGVDVGPPLELVLSDMLQSGMDRQMRGTSVLEYIAVACVFLVSVFIVLTGMTTAVTERIQELAILRCIGATRQQVFASQLWHGAGLGALGGLLGLPLGILFGRLLYLMLGDIIREGLHFSAYSLTLAFGTAVLAGVVGAILPAIAAARVTPLAALGMAGRSARRRGVVLVAGIGLALVITCYYSLRGPDDEQLAFWLGISLGLFSMVSGFFLLSVPLVQMGNTVFGKLLTKLLKLPPDMLVNSVRATPYRHGFTAGALMMGLASMVSLWSVGTALVEDWITPIQFPDAFVVNMTGIDEERIDQLKEADFITNACAVGTFKLPVADQQIFGVEGIAPKNVTAVVFEPGPFLEMTNLEWIQGDPLEAARRLHEQGTILVAREFLAARNIGVGATLRLGPSGNEHEFEVVGVVSSPGLDIATSLFGIQGEFFEQAISCVFFSRDEAARCFQNSEIQMVQFDLTDEADDEVAHKAIIEILGGGQFGSGRVIKQTLQKAAQNFMSILTMFGMMGMVIAGFGAANVIAANVSARRFEYGVLRAAGAERFVLARLILAESAIIAIGACAAGTGMGMFDAWNNAVFYQMMAGLILTPRFPMGPAMIGWGFLLAVAVVAALPPTLALLRSIPVDLLRNVGD